MLGSIISTLAVVAFAASTAAAPAPGRNFPFDSDVSIDRIQMFNAPLSNGSAQLPDFKPRKSRAVTVGRGTQNYTCASSTANDKPKPIGAVATLYNGAAFIPKNADLKRGNYILNELPDFLFHAERSELDKVLPIQGQHFFNAGGSPVFDMRETDSGILVAKKNAEINAPKNSVKGEFGVIPWLALDPVDGSDGLSFGYRTVTAGGSAPPTCEGQKPTFEIQYAAQYFFYN